MLNTSWPVETSHGSEALAWYYRGYITAHLTDPESFLPVHAGMNTQTHNVTHVYGVLSTKERPTPCTHSVPKESETGCCGSKPNSVIMRGSVCTRCVRGAAAGIQSEMYETTMNGYSFILVSGEAVHPSASVRVSVITSRRTAQPAERSGWRKDWDQCPQPSSPESTGLVRMDVGQHALASSSSIPSATPVVLLSD